MYQSKEECKSFKKCIINDLDPIPIMFWLVVIQSEASMESDWPMRDPLGVTCPSSPPWSWPSLVTQLLSALWCASLPAVFAAVCRVTDAFLLQPRLTAAAAARPTSNLGEGWAATSPHFPRKLFKELSCSLCSLYSRLRELARKSKICRYFWFNRGSRSDVVCLLCLSLDLGLKTNLEIGHFAGLII